MVLHCSRHLDIEYRIIIITEVKFGLNKKKEIIFIYFKLCIIYVVET